VGALDVCSIEDGTTVDHMTITVGRKFLIRLLLLTMFTGGIAVGAYVLGRSTQDVRGAEARGVERGKAIGAQQARSDIAKEQEANAASQARSDTIQPTGGRAHCPLGDSAAP